MDKEAIISKLEDVHRELLSWLKHQEDQKWEKGPQGKWTTGQHALHLLQSIKILNKALSYPKFILNFKFGKSNREVRDYDTIIARYHERLKESQGTTFGPSKNMNIPKLKDKKYYIDRLQIQNRKLQYKTKKWTNSQLDSYVLPHPLMGKMPVREIIMWTAYHVEHHTNTLQIDY